MGRILINITADVPLGDNYYYFKSDLEIGVKDTKYYS